MYQVEIHFGAAWWPVGLPQANRDDAEWGIGLWRQLNGANGQDTGFRVREINRHRLLVHCDHCGTHITKPEQLGQDTGDDLICLACCRKAKETA